MSNRALRVAMGSLLCAVGLLATLAAGDPRSIQTALLARGDSADRAVGPATDFTHVMVADATDSGRSPDRLAIAAVPDVAEPIAPELAEPRIASAELNNLRLERDEFTPTKRTWPNQSSTLYRPPPTPGIVSLRPEAAGHVERRVPDPIAFEPFDTPEETPGESVAVAPDEVADAVVDRMKAELASLEAMIAEQAAVKSQPAHVRYQPMPVLSAVASPRRAVADAAAISDAEAEQSPSGHLAPDARATADGRFDLMIAGCQLADIAKLLGEISDENVVIEEAVEGVVKYDLSAVTVSDALSILARTHAIDVLHEPGVVFIQRRAAQADPQPIAAGEPETVAAAPLMIIEPGPSRAGQKRLASDAQDEWR